MTPFFDYTRESEPFTIKIGSKGDVVTVDLTFVPAYTRLKLLNLLEPRKKEQMDAITGAAIISTIASGSATPHEIDARWVLEHLTQEDIFAVAKIMLERVNQCGKEPVGKNSDRPVTA